MTKKKKPVRKNTEQKKIEELENNISESKEQYIRLLAEWENYRKRTTKEKSMSIEYGKELSTSGGFPFFNNSTFQYMSEQAINGHNQQEGDLIVNNCNFIGNRQYGIAIRGTGASCPISYSNFWENELGCGGYNENC